MARLATTNVGFNAALLDRIRAEYMEMPGLRLTAGQARCLFDLDGATCARVLSALEDAKFLTRTPQGFFTRADLQQH